ncbi:MAG: aldolase/citrate lyase family protein [Pseudomonadota bacterium]
MTAAPINKLKARLSAGEKTRGLWLDFHADAVAEMAGNSGADWCLIDGEHAPFDPAALLTQLRVLAGTKAEPIIRVPAAEAWMLKQVLDLGVQNVMVPMIETADQAQAVVRACRYPPDGIRGVGAMVARAGGYGARTDYLVTANAQICVIVQAESARALDNIEAIAAVDGIDAIFIGPADLAADLGKPAAEVRAVIDAGIARIAAAGVAAGLVTSPADCAHFEALGAQLTSIGSDTRIMLAGLQDLFG